MITLVPFIILCAALYWMMTRNPDPEVVLTEERKLELAAALQKHRKKKREKNRR